VKFESPQLLHLYRRSALPEPGYKFFVHGGSFLQKNMAAEELKILIFGQKGYIL
jgi:hypothetical protein